MNMVEYGGKVPYVFKQSDIEGYKGVNWQPSKGLNIYRQPRFREIFNRQMTNWQSSVKREIYSGKKKKVGSDFEWRVYAVSNAKMLEVIRVLGKFWYLRRNLLTKPLFYWYWQKGLNFSDNWQSHNPLVTLDITCQVQAVIAPILIKVPKSSSTSVFEEWKPLFWHRTHK